MVSLSRIFKKKIVTIRGKGISSGAAEQKKQNEEAAKKARGGSKVIIGSREMIR